MSSLQAIFMFTRKKFQKVILFHSNCKRARDLISSFQPKLRLIRKRTRCTKLFKLTAHIQNKQKFPTFLLYLMESDRMKTTKIINSLFPNSQKMDFFNFPVTIEFKINAKIYRERIKKIRSCHTDYIWNPTKKQYNGLV